VFQIAQVTFKPAQGHWHSYHLVGHIIFLFVFYYNYVSNFLCFRVFITYFQN